MATRLNEETKLQILKLKEEGMTNSQVAVACSVSTSTVQRIASNSKESNVHTYIPDYRIAIKPIKKRLECEYGGVLFSVDLDKTELKILDTGVNINDVFGENNMDELEHLGQALISISKSLKKIVIDELEGSKKPIWARYSKG